jgi:hypothetical protein
MTAEEQAQAKQYEQNVTPQLRQDLVDGKINIYDFMSKSSGGKYSPDTIRKTGEGGMPFGAGQTTVQHAVQGLQRVINDYRQGTASDRALQQANDKAMAAFTSARSAYEARLEAAAAGYEPYTPAPGPAPPPAPEIVPMTPTGPPGGLGGPGGIFPIAEFGGGAGLGEAGGVPGLAGGPSGPEQVVPMTPTAPYVTQNLPQYPPMGWEPPPSEVPPAAAPAPPAAAPAPPAAAPPPPPSAAPTPPAAAPPPPAAAPPAVAPAPLVAGLGPASARAPYYDPSYFGDRDSQAAQVQAMVRRDPRAMAARMQADPTIGAMLASTFTPAELSAIFGDIGFNQGESNPVGGLVQQQQG